MSIASVAVFNVCSIRCVSHVWAGSVSENQWCCLRGNAGGQCPPYFRNWRGPPTRITGALTALRHPHPYLTCRSG